MEELTERGKRARRRQQAQLEIERKELLEKIRRQARTMQSKEGEMETTDSRHKLPTKDKQTHLMEQPSWEEKKWLMKPLQEKHLDIEQDSQGSVSVEQEEIVSRPGLNQKEEELLKRVEKLELVEQNLDEEIKQGAAEEALKIERLKKLSEQTQHSLRIKELKEREMEIETRLNEKIKKQIELDRKLSLLSKQEEQLILESKNFDGMAQSTPKVNFGFDSQKKASMRQQSGKQEPFLSPELSETQIRVSEEQAIKEDALNRREEYLRHLEKELQQKEDSIREQLRLKPASTGKKQTLEMSNMIDKVQKDTSMFVKRQTDTCSSRDEEQDITSKHKEISPFLKPYINFFSGAEPTPKNESNFEEWKVEIECLKKSGVYPEYIVNQALRNSVKGQARRVLFTLGSAATTEQIMDKLERTFGNVASGQTVLQEFYTAEQKENESVTLWGIRLEEIFQRAVEKGFATETQRDKMLIERFWRSLQSIDLQNATSVYYHSIQSFEVLRQKIRAEEYAMASNKKAIDKSLARVREKESSVQNPDTKSVSKASFECVSDLIPNAQHSVVTQDQNAKLLKELMERMSSLEKSINRISQSSSCDRTDQANRDSGQNYSNKATNKTNKKPLNQ